MEVKTSDHGTVRLTYSKEPEDFSSQPVDLFNKCESVRDRRRVKKDIAGGGGEGSSGRECRWSDTSSGSNLPSRSLSGRQNLLPPCLVLTCLPQAAGSEERFQPDKAVHRCDKSDESTCQICCAGWHVRLHVQDELRIGKCPNIEQHVQESIEEKFYLTPSFPPSPLSLALAPRVAPL